MNSAWLHLLDIVPGNFLQGKYLYCLLYLSILLYLPLLMLFISLFKFKLLSTVLPFQPATPFSIVFLDDQFSPFIFFLWEGLISPLLLKCSLLNIEFLIDSIFPCSTLKCHPTASGWPPEFLMRNHQIPYKWWVACLMLLSNFSLFLTESTEHLIYVD